MDQYECRREQMVQSQIALRGIRDEKLLAAMRVVPRERFVSERMAEFAYEDSALPIEQGQTISQPYVVALMIDAAEIGARDRVLEVGAGSGYAAAVLSRIAARVYAIERHEQLATAAQGRFVALGYQNIELKVGDGSTGWPEAAPFDAILVAACGPMVPPALKEQLAIGGRLVMPVGQESYQRLVKVTRKSDADFDQHDLGSVVFVPLVGEQGWADDGSRTDIEK